VVNRTVPVRPATVRAVVGAVRVLGAVVCAGALAARFVWGLGSVTFTASNFFAYLTVQSNLAFVLVTLMAGIVALRSQRDPRWLTAARATVLSCTVSAGAVFALLVEQAGARGLPIDVPWSDQVLHFWLPALALLEWVISPGRGRAAWRILLFVQAFTVVWGIITLIRGPIVGWYPYFFLDPAQVGSVGEFMLLSGIALASFATISTGVVLLTRMRPVLEN
jgi:hypothetical protein